MSLTACHCIRAELVHHRINFFQRPVNIELNCGMPFCAFSVRWNNRNAYVVADRMATPAAVLYFWKFFKTYLNDPAAPKFVSQKASENYRAPVGPMIIRFWNSVNCAVL